MIQSLLHSLSLSTPCSLLLEFQQAWRMIKVGHQACLLNYTHCRQPPTKRGGGCPRDLNSSFEQGYQATKERCCVSLVDFNGRRKKQVKPLAFEGDTRLCYYTESRKTRCKAGKNVLNEIKTSADVFNLHSSPKFLPCVSLQCVPDV